MLDDISSENLGIYGVEKSRNVRVTAHLEKGYAAQIREGLGSLEEGMTITVQGKFLYDRMELEDATIVDKATGAVLTGDQLKAFGAVKSGEVVPPPGKK